MKKYLILGNPLGHSLSPKLHNYWIKQNNLDGVYETKETNKENIEEVISDIKKGEIEGMNVTVPFKKTVIPYLDELSDPANRVQSVNTIYKKDNKIIGDNTDIEGFKLGIKYAGFEIKNKTIFIIGAGGVVPSVLLSLINLGASKIYLSNRTLEKAQKLKILFPEIKIIDWGNLPDFDVILNATSLGLNENDTINLDLNNLGNDKFFYDIIYSPRQTKFLLTGKKLGHKIENGLMMFLFQAQLSFEIWHGIKPKVDKKIIEMLEND